MWSMAFERTSVKTVFRLGREIVRIDDLNALVLQKRGWVLRKSHPLLACCAMRK